jgi:hypothetical protein
VPAGTRETLDYDVVWMHGGRLFVLNAPESQVMRGLVYRSVCRYRRGTCDNSGLATPGKEVGTEALRTWTDLLRELEPPASVAFRLTKSRLFRCMIGL